MFLRSYCLTGFGDIEELKKDLSFISEPTANFVSGNDVIITTFRSALVLSEIEEFLNMNERDYIIFEMLPATFSANLNNEEFQHALFGGKIDHYSDNSFQHISEGIKEFIKTIKEEMEEEGSLPFKFKVDQEDTPTVDDILDKISKVGIKNLTNKEKEILNNYSNDK